MRRLVLVRHARTAWNAVDRAQGHADVEIDAIGHRQAATAAPVLATYRPALLWTSDLTRARESAAYVEKETGLVATLDPRLREYALGERTGLTRTEFAEQMPAEYASWIGGHPTGGVAGAEPVVEVGARLRPAYEEILAALAPGETGMVVSHGACLKDTVTMLLGWPDEATATLVGIDNCAWIVLSEATPGGRLRLETYNRGADFASGAGVG